MGYSDRVDFNTLLGKIFTDITVNEDNDEIIFTCDDDTKYKMYHDQDCCESVSIDEINGDLKDLIGNFVTLAEESTSSDYQEWQAKNEEWDESFTWTFYRLATVKGYVNIRWYGQSNGYYSESVDFELITDQEEC